MTGRDAVLAIGLMSGTSMDGIDAALLRTDGERLVEPVAALGVPYDEPFRARLRAVLGCRGDVEGVARDLTDLHAAAVRGLLDKAGVAAERVRVVGFHGHTVFHDPDAGRTVQIGDGARLAAATGLDTVFDFRSADVAAGGQGAPLAPAFHAALSRGPWPLCWLNLGGVANVTWVGGAPEGGPAAFPDLLAFDTGPGNALIDDWVSRRCGIAYDAGGALASRGQVDAAVLQRLLDHPYFDRRPPKSLDRDAFSAAGLDALSDEDGAATLAAFTVASVGRARTHLPEPPTRWIVTGGGRKNGVLMAGLRAELGAPVVTTEDEGIDGDFVEAQAFAYLAVRSLRSWPISGPGTTGVPAALCGGRLATAAGDDQADSRASASI